MKKFFIIKAIIIGALSAFVFLTVEEPTKEWQVPRPGAAR